MNTHGSKREIFCQSDPFFEQIQFWMRETTWSPDRVTVAYALPPKLKTITPETEGTMQPPMFSLHREQAQQFMDELWRVGFRPMEGTGSAGALAATERHLSDMRALVFKTNKIAL